MVKNLFPLTLQACKISNYLNSSLDATDKVEGDNEPS